MAHAETCPVCGGSGRVGSERYERKDCHGCDGKGWVEVGDTYPVVVPIQSWPIHEPTITFGPWVYESGTYSANVEVFI